MGFLKTSVLDLAAAVSICRWVMASLSSVVWYKGRKKKGRIRK